MYSRRYLSFTDLAALMLSTKAVPLGEVKDTVLREGFTPALLSDISGKVLASGIAHLHQLLY